ncbi:MAG: hypothetical protein IIY32_08940 [Thermoguttaceae bacterium]|nr:hypothetical protein [Thermoguttaceae bacterium]MBQ3821745.1 hypothetical protein [Thermoguttaceae bacterium]
MNITELIKTRKSVRTFDGRPLSEEDEAKLRAFCEKTENPFGIPVSVVWLDAKERGLSSPVIVGETAYLACKTPKRKRCELAVGYAFERIVLYAWSLGVGTTWIGGTMKRELFEKAAETGDGEFMPVVSPLGYPAKERSEIDVRLRERVRGDEREPASNLFFELDFLCPMSEPDEALEAVRWAPSAVNLQPWRVIKDGPRYHFYEKHSLETEQTVGWDVQKIDMGIALYHFMAVSGGRCEISDPRLAADPDVEYIATVTV